MGVLWHTDYGGLQPALSLTLPPASSEGARTPRSGGRRRQDAEEGARKKLSAGRRMPLKYHHGLMEEEKTNTTGEAGRKGGPASHACLST